MEIWIVMHFGFVGWTMGEVSYKVSDWDFGLAGCSLDHCGMIQCDLANHNHFDATEILLWFLWILLWFLLWFYFDSTLILLWFRPRSEIEPKIMKIGLGKSGVLRNPKLQYSPYRMWYLSCRSPEVDFYVIFAWILYNLDTVAGVSCVRYIIINTSVNIN